MTSFKQLRLDGTTVKDLKFMNEKERYELAKKFVTSKIFGSRAKYLKWSEVTKQTAQFDDGYLAQHLVSLVTGEPGTEMHGKGSDLATGNEIKSGKRIDQKGGMEDSHILIRFGDKEKFDSFLDCPKCYITFFDFDLLFRPRFEIWRIEPKSQEVKSYFYFYWQDHIAGRHDDWGRRELNLRIYPDRSRIKFHKNFLRLKPRLIFLARDYRGDGTGKIEVFDPKEGKAPDIELIQGPVGKALQPLKMEHYMAKTKKGRVEQIKEFFKEMAVEHYYEMQYWNILTKQPLNTGFDNLSQHLVSLAVEVPGIGSNARGMDLLDGSEIKSANELGGIDRPRWNLGSKWNQMIEWPHLYLVRWDLSEIGKLRARVCEPSLEEFHELVATYRKDHPHSPNMQLHPVWGRKERERHLNIARNEGGRLDLKLILKVEETAAGDVSVVLD